MYIVYKPPAVYTPLLSPPTNNLLLLMSLQLTGFTKIANAMRC